MSEWKEYRLGELLKIKYGKDHKKLKEGNIPVYGSGGIMRMGDEFLSDKPSVLIPRKGTLSNIFYVDVPFWTVDTMFWSEINETIVIPKYLYYAIKDLKWDSMNVGSAVPSLTVPVIESVTVNLPSLSEQKKIAAQLSEIDSKIECNRKICANLEAQVQALFKHWFIDFAPFKDGKFVESELGMIPEGWRVGRLEDLCIKVGSGGTPKSSNREYYQGTIPWFGTGEFNDSFLFDSEKHITQEAIDESSARLYPVHTVLIAMYGATVGKLSILSVDAAFNQAALGLVAYDNIGYPYVFLTLLSNRKALVNLACGAAQQNLNAGNIKSFVTIMPNNEVTEKFNSIILPLFKKIEKSCKENDTLSTLRDTLLPKLMSGQIKL